MSIRLNFGFFLKILLVTIAKLYDETFFGGFKTTYLVIGRRSTYIVVQKLIFILK